MLHKNIYNKLPQKYQKFYNDLLSDVHLGVGPIDVSITSQASKVERHLNNLNGILEQYTEQDLATCKEYRKYYKEYRHKFRELKRLLQSYHDFRRLQ